MSPATGAGSRTLLLRLRDAMAKPGDGQQRLDQVVSVIASSMAAEVCSIYLRVDEKTLELCATEGLRKEAVHTTGLRMGQGLVGRIAERAEPIVTNDAPNTPGFQYLPETGEDIYASFCGVPIQRLGRNIGVLVVQNVAGRDFSDDEVDALSVTAMVIAEMAESGQLTGGDGVDLSDRGSRTYRAVGASDGAAVGVVHLHEPKLAITQPFTDDVESERKRLEVAMAGLREEVDELLESNLVGAPGEYRDVIEAYRMFAHDKGWLRRLDEAVMSGVVAEVAVERVQSEARSRMDRAANSYLRDRLHDLDDLANRLLRRLSGNVNTVIPKDAVLIARHIGPGELLEHARFISGVVLEEGGVGGHAAIVARALAIPMIVGADRIVAQAENGDEIALDGDAGVALLRPGAEVIETFRQRVSVAEEAKARYQALRDKPATTQDGVDFELMINAGLVSDMPELYDAGATGVGLFRTELQFLIRSTLPNRSDLAAIYRHVIDAANGAPVVFRTLDIGSDKVLPYIKRRPEDNPAMGWRAVRVGLDRPMLLKLQFQSLLRGAEGRPLDIMFPFIADEAEFFAARDLLLKTCDQLRNRGVPISDDLKIGAMLETPSIGFASDKFFAAVDFISVGGNDLMQFFFAADRGNDLVRQRYSALSPSFLRFLSHVVSRCAASETKLSFCGEAAGKPVEALALAAIGFRTLSMRPASVGPVKAMLRSVDLSTAQKLVADAIANDATDIHDRLEYWLGGAGAA
ncbi:MAG: phosphoenolpyruvate--protein phosphotransferase [Pikeienuella sp.]